MTRTQAWAIHLSNLLVGGTGLVYAWMCYFAESDDPYSIANHPWQPDLQHLHILAAPLLVFVVGLVWGTHVWPQIRSGDTVRRKSGFALLLLFFPMAVSGYALQVSVEEQWREAWQWVHGVTSVSWLVFAVIHPLIPIRSHARVAG